MHEINVSFVFLLGFPNLHSFNMPFFFFLLTIYCVTICGNILIVTLVSISNNLHSPMYFFITNVSLLDILISTDILPNLLHIVLHEGGTMSLTACMSQFYVFACSTTSECLLLTVMSYDRYVAICNPLRYNAIIQKKYCFTSVFISWLLAFLMTMDIATYKLDFCGPNVIDNFFCDFTPILDLSCSDTSFIRNQGFLFAVLGIICPFIMIVISYVHIISTILKIQSISGKQKAFSTCSSHLTSVSIFYGSLLSVYMTPTKGKLSVVNKALSLLYTVVTPFLNPFIYSLRNKDCKEAFLKIKQNVSI